MRNKQWYESLFQDYGQKYDSESFTQGTIGECDFIEKELNSNKTVKILDVGCGTGVVGVDLLNLIPSAQLCGLDIAASVLRVAKEKIPNGRKTIAGTHIPRYEGRTPSRTIFSKVKDTT